MRAAREKKAAELARSAQAAKAAGEARVARLEQRQQAQRDKLEGSREGRARRVESRTRQLETRREAMRERVAKRKPRRRRDGVRWVLLAVIVVLLLLLLRDCREPEPEPEPTGALATGGTQPVAPPTEPEPAPPPSPDLEARERPPMVPPPLKVPPWVVGFRMQVSARSPRLAKCFEGMERPGRIKWTATVEPRSGQVSDHAIEPQLRTGELSARETRCLVEALSAPDYRIEAPDETAPTRISVVLEF